MTNKILGFSVVVNKEKKGYSCWCPDIDVADYGDTIEDALKNLKEGMKLHLSCLTSSELNELKKRKSASLVATLEIPLPA